MKSKFNLEYRVKSSIFLIKPKMKSSNERLLNEWFHIRPNSVVSSIFWFLSSSLNFNHRSSHHFNVSLLLCGLLMWSSILLTTVSSVELTFELPDNAKECFHENIEKGKQTTFEFQVVTGGHYDVDASVEAPNKQVIYKEVKKQYDTFVWTPDVSGVYTFCFSNEFSTFSHKLVYMDLQVGDEAPLPGVGEHITAMTQIESSANTIHENLNGIIDYQTHHRLRESQSRKRGEDLNERVMWWSIFQTLAILIITIGQVMVLRNFFAEKRPSEMRNPLFSK